MRTKGKKPSEELFDAKAFAARGGSVRPKITVPWPNEYEAILAAVPQLSERSSQCFMCSRIYYGRELERCPHCGSASISCYTTDELRLFSRGPVDATWQEPLST